MMTQLVSLQYTMPPSDIFGTLGWKHWHPELAYDQQTLKRKLPMRYLTLTLAALAITACSEPAEPPAPQADDPESDVIGAPLHEALDKASGVEELNAGRKNELDEAMDAAE